MPTREIKTIYSLSGEQKYVDAIKQINKQQSVLNAELKKNNAGFDLTGDKQGKLKSQIETLNQQIQLQRQKVEESKAAFEKYSAQTNQNAETTRELHIQYLNAETSLSKLQTKLISANKDLALQESKLKAVGEAAEKAGEKMQKVGDKMSSAGSALTVGVTAPIVAAAGYSAKAAIDFESAFAGVRKTVDATTEQLDGLETGIREMSKEVPASAVEISAVAEAAGQLGIKTDNILGFSKAMIDMGESTNLTADEAATSLAQFANITQMNQENFDRLGSSIVAVGNAGASTEKDITEMALRLAGAGNQVGLSEADIVGLASSLSDVGIEAEAGGTAFSKVMIEMQLAATTGSKANEVLKKTGMSLRDLEMYADTDAKGFKAMAHDLGYTAEELKGFMSASKSLGAFSKATGISAADFKKAYEQDAVGAIQLFVKNLATAGDRGEDAITILEDMGITEVRMRDALLRSAGAGDKMASSIKLSNDAWVANNALTKEASQRYETNASKLKMSQNRMTDAAITVGEQLLPVISDLMEDVAKAAEAFGNMNPEMQKTVMVALSIAAAAGPVLKTLGAATTVVGGLTSAWGKHAVKVAASKAATAAATSATGGLSGATAALTGSLGSGLLTVLGPVALGLGGMYLAYQNATEGSRAAGDAAEEFYNGVSNWHSEVEVATSILDGLNQSLLVNEAAMSDYDAGITDAQSKIIGLAETAAKESRKYTDKELLEIQKLIGLIDDYTSKKTEALKSQDDVIQTMANYESDMTGSKANEYIKGAQETKDKLIAIADQTYTDKIALLTKQYKEEGLLTKAAFEAFVTTAQNERDEKINSANKKHGETLSIIQKSYEDQNAAALSNFENVGRISAEIDELRDRNLEKFKETGNVEKDYLKNKKALEEELAIAYKEAEKAGLDSWVAMASDTQLYGGQVSDESEAIIAGLIAGVDRLPEEYRQSARDAIDGLIKGFAEKEQDVYDKASGIAGGAISRLDRGFDNRSPSHRLEKTGIFAGQGLEIGIDKSGKEAIKTAGKIADGVIDETDRLAQSREYLLNKISQSGLTIPSLPNSNPVSQSQLSLQSNANQKIVHSGKVVVEGVNDKGQLAGVAEIILDQLRMDLMMAGG